MALSRLTRGVVGGSFTRNTRFAFGHGCDHPNYVRAKDNFIQSICNGNLANLWSSTSGGVTNDYQYDALNRLTNVVGPAASLAKYAYDWAGNLQAMRYANPSSSVN